MQLTLDYSFYNFFLRGHKLDPSLKIVIIEYRFFLFYVKGKALKLMAGVKCTSCMYMHDPPLNIFSLQQQTVFCHFMSKTVKTRKHAQDPKCCIKKRELDMKNCITPNSAYIHYHSALYVHGFTRSLKNSNERKTCLGPVTISLTADC